MAAFITLTRYTPTTAIHVNMDNVLTIEADEKGFALALAGMSALGAKRKELTDEPR